jgi:hypothetical protein
MIASLFYEETELRLGMANIMARMVRVGHLYTLLPNFPIDWELEGHYICRVIGMSCYAKKFKIITKLEIHLQNKFHRVSTIPNVYSDETNAIKYLQC